MSATHCGQEVTGRFCAECGAEVPSPPTSPVTDPGVLVTRWNTLRTELNAAVETYRGVAVEMDGIAGTLQREHEIQLPRQVAETPSPTTAARTPSTPNAGALSGDDVQPLRPQTAEPPREEAQTSQPTSAPESVMRGTKTGPMGSVDSSAAAAEVPVGPSEAALDASRQGTAPAQYATGSIEDGHEGKVDVRVDEVRKDSGAQANEAPTDDSKVFQQNVARTLERAVQGRT